MTTVAHDADEHRGLLTSLGEKIFLDRYALKDITRATLAVGDTVMAIVDPKTNQRDIGTIVDLAPPHVSVELRHGESLRLSVEQIDKPLETHPSQMMDRVARGIAAVEATPAQRDVWAHKFHV